MRIGTLSQGKIGFDLGLIHSAIQSLPKGNYELEVNKESGFRIQKDGNKWCATAPGFINLQESDAGFGDTPIDAFQALVALGYGAEV
jgi:hypothetical protein